MTVGITSSTSSPLDCAIDTSFMTGCNFEQYKQIVEEGLQGEDKEFFERLKNRGLEKTFLAYDNNGDGVLSEKEAITVSSAGIDQRRFSRAINGQTMNTYLQKLMEKFSSIDITADYESILSSLGSTGSISSLGSTGGNLTSGSATSSAAANFALQFSGYSAEQMAPLMSETRFDPGLWCADFVYYCLYKTGEVPEGYSSINYAGCGSVAAWARSTGRAFSDHSLAKPGDLLIMNSEGHIGIVTKVDSQGIHTIEGNTSNDSGVYDGPGGGGWVNERIRDFSCVSTFVRI